MEKIYLEDLKQLEEQADKAGNTPMMTFGKVLMLVILNMRYERIMINRDLDTHPYLLTRQLIKEASIFLKMWQESAFIEDSSRELPLKGKEAMESVHKSLFQRLWTRFTPEEYEGRIQRYTFRLRLNNLANGWLKGFRCIDFGCGHGNFAHALLREGAEYVYAIDFGEDSIKYAIKQRDSLGIQASQIEFKLESVYKVSKEDNSFDFAVQNGVFHHLEDEIAAIKEVRRVLKPGGWFWFYTIGSGAIGRELLLASRRILRDVSQETVLSCLDCLNIETGKRYHLSDALNATYRYTSWNELTGRLSSLGFGNFRRLVGGFETDFDHDVIAKDKYGPEKFGEGDLRLLAQKLP